MDREINREMRSLVARERENESALVGFCQFTSISEKRESQLRKIPLHSAKTVPNRRHWCLGNDSWVLSERNGAM